MNRKVKSFKNSVSIGILKMFCSIKSFNALI